MTRPAPTHSARALVNKRSASPGLPSPSAFEIRVAPPMPNIRPKAFKTLIMGMAMFSAVRPGAPRPRPTSMVSPSTYRDTPSIPPMPGRI